MEKFDAIVVGGGLSGLSAAYTMARNGLEVLLLERGDYSGSKNVTGGRIYVSSVRSLFPDLWKKAPLERHINCEEVCILDKESSVLIRYEGTELNQEPYQSYSVLRGKFDKWFAKQAERIGAMIVCKSRVDGLIFENGSVIGVRAGGEELYASVVIACDGVLSFIAQQAGLRKNETNYHYYAVGFKEIIEMDREILERRFNLDGDEGVARMFMGDVTEGKFGGGFLYTNKESLSLGIVLGIGSLIDEKMTTAVPELMERFKNRPEIAKLVSEGETVEYSAHVIPEGGLEMMPKLFGDGILVAGDAAGLSMNIGVTVRGMEYAMASGYYAAQAVMIAKEKNDFSKKSLSIYEKLLKESFVLKDFEQFKHALHALDNPRLFTVYPKLAGNIMRDLYHVGEEPKERLMKTVKKHITFREGWSMLKDLKGVAKI